MPEWLLAVGIGLAWVLATILLGRSNRADKRARQKIAEWAQARGWTFREGGRGHAWTTPLPYGCSDASVVFQVDGALADGALAGQAFTVVHLLQIGAPGYTAADTAVVVLYLPAAYPDVDIKPRSMFRRPSTADRIGQDEFDRKFRILTRAPDGPASVISTALADAHVNGDVPLWKLRSNELMCYSRDEPGIENLDAMLRRALRVAELLTAHMRQTA